MKREIRSLTGIRALAAWGVVVYHFADQLGPTLIDQQAYARLSHFGANGVDLFFILSGFIITYTYSLLFQRFTWSNYASYLKKRLARIYPAHLFGLLLMLGLGLALTFVTPDANFFERNSVAQLLGHLTLVSSWNPRGDSLSWNVPAWSISSEWLAYLVFPWLLVLVRPLRPFFLMALCVGLLVLMAGLAPVAGVNQGLVRIGTEFTVGMAMYYLVQPSGADTPAGPPPVHRTAAFLTGLPWGRIGLVAGLAYLVLGATLGWLGMNVRWAVLLFIPLLFSLMYERGGVARLLASPLAGYWGRVSYSLYITHYIVLAGFKFLYSVPVLGRTPLGLLALTVLQFCAIAAFAAATYHFIEEPGRKLLTRARAPRVAGVR